MRSCFRTVLVLSLAFGLAGCNLPTPAPAVTPMRASPTSLLPGDTPIATKQPTLAPTAAVPANWQTYTDQAYGFTFRYPAQGQIVSRQDHSARISLPVTQGTNLVEKFIDVAATENADPCVSQNPGVSQSQPLTVNGIPFLEESGADAGAGQVYEWLAYSTSKNNVCVSLTFVLHSTNPGNYLTPPPLFDKTAESKLFSSILATFAWLNP
ncbi:MAG: hypothetical protein KJ606_05145 [Chloroflexi bacterium]|nr:hypothetical protein [Chloroflexota bacterium]